MKKIYTDKKRTSIALDPDLTKRIEKVSKKSGMKISTYAQEVLKSALDADEMKQTLEFYKKLQDSGQYQKIKQLEDDVVSLKKEQDSSWREVAHNLLLVTELTTQFAELLKAGKTVKAKKVKEKQEKLFKQWINESNEGIL